MTSYGTQIVQKLDAISSLVGATEMNGQPSMQLDVLMRLDAIIDAIVNGGGGGQQGLTPVKSADLFSGGSPQALQNLSIQPTATFTDSQLMR